MFFRLLVLSSLFLTARLHAFLPNLSNLSQRSISVELQEPVYKDGVLTTDKGGIIKGEDLFLQAKKIAYIQCQEGEKSVHKVEAEGDLLFQFKGKVYTGSHLEFDLDNDTGQITDVLTSNDDWYVGGKKLVFKKDGSGVISDAYITTDENVRNDWGLEAKEVHLYKNSTLKAKSVSFKVMHSPIFWLPSLTADLKNSSKTPFKYRVRWFGRNGPWLGIAYDFHTTEHWKNRLLFDVSVRGKLGGGVTSEYKNPDGKERLSLFNYYAHDLTTPYSERKNRYRFQGKYQNLIVQDSVQMRASYDKLSDQDMPRDYISRGLDSGRAGPTELLLSRSDTNWVGSLAAKTRLNNFQTVKQQLPLFNMSMRPVSLGTSGLVLDSKLSAGYLNYRYAVNTPDVSNFHSSRAELDERLYRHFLYGPFHLTPYVGARAIGYGNSPQHDAKFLASGSVGFEAHTRFIRHAASQSHILEPYVQYEYVTAPTVNPHRHYLFDMQDGLYRVNSARFGTRNYLHFRPDIEGFSPQLNADLYARSFINTPTIGSPVPRVYLDSRLKATSNTLYSLKSAWDTQRNQLDHFNARGEMTVSENIAVALEYRYRDSFAWRKVDPENFMIDTFRTEKSLRHSLMSDRRYTLLPHLFVRFTPNVAMEFITRHGWGRRHAKRYNEYEVNLITRIANVCYVTFNFQHREVQNRFSIDFSVGAKPPSSFVGGTGDSTRKLGQGNYEIP